MSRRHIASGFCAAVALLALLAVPVVGKVKIKTQFDKTFNFSKVHTYAWHPQGAGELKLLEQSGDDPARLKAMLDPIIQSEVERQLGARGLVPATGGGTPDLYVNYYVLIGPNASSQYMGQFVGGAPEWGLPPFGGATQSLKIYEQGSLILDLSSPALNSAVWRGMADTEVDRELTPAQREQRLRGAIADMLKKFPPKP
jgi:hypothetical protein